MIPDIQYVFDIALRGAMEMARSLPGGTKVEREIKALGGNIPRHLIGTDPKWLLTAKVGSRLIALNEYRKATGAAWYVAVAAVDAALGWGAA